MASALPFSDDPWVPAVVGGVVSIPLTVGLYVQSGLGSEMSLNMLLVAGVVAGYLAARRSQRVDRASVLAGVLGGLPVYVFLFDAVLGLQSSFASAWSSHVLGLAVSVFAASAIVGVCAIAGFIGGAFGSWIADQLGRTRDATPTS